MKWFVLICLILTKCESGYTDAQHQFVLGAFASKEDMDMTTKTETVTNIALEKLVPFQDHPFQVRDDEQMQMITESIQSVGVLVPAIVRPLENGTYELIAGHRRKHACEMIGLEACEGIARTIHVWFSFNVLHTNAIDHNMDMDVSSTVVTVRMRTDYCLMARKMIITKLNAKLLSAFNC